MAVSRERRWVVRVHLESAVTAAVATAFTVFIEIFERRRRGTGGAGTIPANKQGTWSVDCLSSQLGVRKQ